MRDLTFDTETSSFYDKFKPLTRAAQTVQLLEVAAILSEGDTILNSISLYVRPVDLDGLKVDPKAFQAHGIDRPRLESAGVPPKVAVAMFNNILRMADRIVAHNVEFDLSIMQIAYDECGVSPGLLKAAKTVCTVQSSKNVLKIVTPGKSGYKYPTLTEAYAALVDPAGFTGAHGAWADANACWKVFRALVKGGHLKD